MELTEALELASNNILTLSGKQARQVLTTLTRETQRRYSDKSLRYAPATFKLERAFNGKAPTVRRGLTTDGQVRHYIRVNRDYLTAQTSTREGFQEFENRISNTFGVFTDGIYYEDLTKTQKRNFWEFYNSLSETGADWRMLDSQQRAQLIMKYLHQRGNKEERVTRMMNELHNIANEQREMFNQRPTFR